MTIHILNNKTNHPQIRKPSKKNIQQHHTFTTHPKKIIRTSLTPALAMAWRPVVRPLVCAVGDSSGPLPSSPSSACPSSVADSHRPPLRLPPPSPPPTRPPRTTAHLHVACRRTPLRQPCPLPTCTPPAAALPTTHLPVACRRPLLRLQPPSPPPVTPHHRLPPPAAARRQEEGIEEK